MGSKPSHSKDESADRRKSGQGTPPPGTVVDRRLGLGRRTEDPSPVPGSASGPTSGPSSAKNSTDPSAEALTGLERRRGRGRRLSDFTKSAEEGEMTTEQFLFLMAIDAFKKSNDRMFPTWTDVLEVIRLLGYRKTMPSELNLPAAEDWLERSDADANVRPDRWAERFTHADDDSALAAAKPPKLAPKGEKELTDEALAAFEAAFGDEDEAVADIDTDIDIDSDINDAA